MLNYSTHGFQQFLGYWPEIREELETSRKQLSNITGMFRPGDELLTVEQLADRLHVKPSFVYDLTRTRSKLRKDGIPHRRIGTRKGLIFSWQEVCEWLDQRKEET